MESETSPAFAAGSESLLSSVMDELKRSTKRIPPHATSQFDSSVENTISADTPAFQKGEKSGIAEYSAYSRIVDGLANDEKTSNEVKIKSPPVKPKRKKKNEAELQNKGSDPSLIGTDLKNILDSAFSNNNEKSMKMPDDSECIVYTPEDTPVRSRSYPYKIQLTDKSEENYRNHHGSSIHSDITSDSKYLVDMRKLTSSRSFDSIEDRHYETVSMFSQLSDEDPTNNWNDGGHSECGDAISLASFASADGQLDEKLHRKRIDPKARAKQLKKQAAAGKEKVGAFLDAAASNATNRIRKFRKPSIKFPAGRTKLPNLGRKIGSKQTESNNFSRNIFSPTNRTNESVSDNEDTQKRLMLTRHEGLDTPSCGSYGLKPSRQSVIKSGYLKKQGGKIKTWNERWFILKGDRLSYYKEPNGKLIATIFLAGSQVISSLQKINEAHKYTFELVPGSKQLPINNNHESYLLSASSQSDMDEWIKAIRRVILSPFGGGIFGQSLDETLRHDRRLGSSVSIVSEMTASPSELTFRQVPIIVENCVEFMRSNDRLAEEGLFRLPGLTNEVKDLQDAYDMGERPVFPQSTDVHTVASLLKCYLRELPDPVIPFELYDSLLKAAKITQSNCGEKSATSNALRESDDVRKIIKEQVNLLPQSNFALLRYLCHFLDEVQSHSDSNKMDIANLALVFGPNLMRAKEENALTMMADQSHVQRIVHYFIESHQYFFPAEKNLFENSVMDETHSDAGIGTLATASPGGTSALRRAGDDSGTGSLDVAPYNSNKRAPPVPTCPPPIRKPLKPKKRRQSAQSSGSNEVLTSDEIQRNSHYDNAGDARSDDADSLANSSVHAAAGNLGKINSSRPSGVSHYQLSPMRGTSFHLTPVNNEASNHGTHSSSDQTTKIGVTGKQINRLSSSSISDESSALSHSAMPSKIHHEINAKQQTMHDSGVAGSERRSDSSSSFDKCVSPDASPRRPTYKELQQQVVALKHELKKKQVECENKMKMLEADLSLNPNNVFQTSETSFSRRSNANETPSMPFDEVGSVSDDWDPSNASGRRLSAESQSEMKYREEANRHAMTKIRLRNTERALKQAEERNKQLQKEMEQFFESFGGMLNQDSD